MDILTQIFAFVLIVFSVFTWLNVKSHAPKYERTNELKAAQNPADEGHKAFVRRVSVNGDGTKRDHENRTKKLLAEALAIEEFLEKNPRYWRHGRCPNPHVVDGKEFWEHEAAEIILGFKEV